MVTWRHIENVVFGTLVNKASSFPSASLGFEYGLVHFIAE
jgi:hypothetical protein